MNKFQSSLVTFRQRFSAAPLRLPGLSPAEQTRLTWAKSLSSCADLPPAYHGFFASRQAQGLSFPYTVLLPAFEGFFQRSPEMLVCDLGDSTALLVKSGAGCQVSIFPHADLCRLEWRVSLLDGRLKISGYSLDGVLTSASLRFNAVTDYLLLPLVERMRRAAAGIPDSGDAVDPGLFSEWRSLSYKFMNYARRSLLPGEQLVQAVFQPEVRKPLLHFGRRTIFRSLAPALALILTDRELVLIREETARGAGSRYGGTWVYLPLGRIVGVRSEEKEGELLSLVVDLPGQERLECAIQSSQWQEVAKLTEKIKE